MSVIARATNRYVFQAQRAQVSATKPVLLLLIALVCSINSQAEDFSSQLVTVAPGVAYKNIRIPDVPWSTHVVRVDRSRFPFEIHSAHARRRAVGLSTLTDQIRLMNPAIGTPVAGINGDFYQRDSAFAGDPRGLQIIDGELISAPTGGVSFWIDASGEPHATNINSQFKVSWPDGTETPFGLNGARRNEELQLYTPALGPSTKTARGRELVLEAATNGLWLPLKIGKTYKARVREVRDAGNSPLTPETMVLSISPAMFNRVQSVDIGAIATISTASDPNLEGATTAIGGGPLVVRGGKPQRVGRSNYGGFEFRSMGERHPRSALGWNKEAFFLIEVDGRQEGAAGMTLTELGSFIAQLGCSDAMSLDGGGSATLWCTGKIRNSPCDGSERPIANSVIVVRKNPETRNGGPKSDTRQNP